MATGIRSALRNNEARREEVATQLTEQINIRTIYNQLASAADAESLRINFVQQGLRDLEDLIYVIQTSKPSSTIANERNTEGYKQNFRDLLYNSFEAFPKNFKKIDANYLNQAILAGLGRTLLDQPILRSANATTREKIYASAVEFQLTVADIFKSEEHTIAFFKNAPTAVKELISPEVLIQVCKKYPQIARLMFEEPALRKVLKNRPGLMEYFYDAQENSLFIADKIAQFPVEIDDANSIIDTPLLQLQKESKKAREELKTAEEQFQQLKARKKCILLDAKSKVLANLMLQPLADESRGEASRIIDALQQEYDRISQD